MSFYLRLLIKIKIYNDVPHIMSILRYELEELNKNDPLNKYLTILKLKELAELTLDNTDLSNA